MDLQGYPGIEDYEYEAFENIRTFVSAAFKVLELSWTHPRVEAFLQRVEKSLNEQLDRQAIEEGREPVFYQVRSRHQLPFVCYHQLAMHLAQLILDERTAIQDVVSRHRAKQLMGQLVNSGSGKWQ